MKPCVIIYNPTSARFEAFNEDGRLCASGIIYSTCVRHANVFGYDEVSLNSRCGKTILDKIDNKNNKLKPL